MPVPSTNISEFATKGYTMARGLFSYEEAEQLREHFLWINREHRRVSDNITDEGDPLAKYPRVGQPHRWDETSLNWMIDPRLNEWMTAILGCEPYAVQTMFYYKPPGARGQALHQDQFYLRVEPGTCVAAWMAVDRCDEGKRLSLCRAGYAGHSRLNAQSMPIPTSASSTIRWNCRPVTSRSR